MIILSDGILHGYRATQYVGPKELPPRRSSVALLRWSSSATFRVSSPQARIPKISNSRLLRRSVGERRISVATVSAQSVVVQLAKLLLAATTSALASASASSILAGSLPPPRALSGRPPPFPPTIGAIC